MRKKGLKHRPVIETQGVKGDISEDPKMQELTRLYDDMTKEEQARTIDYLTGALPPDKSKEKPEAESQLKKGGKNAMTELLTPKEAAAFLKVSVITLAKWRGRKSGPAYTRTGRTIKYSREALEDYLRKNVVEN
jgi:excisionase family DNA binding protein